MILDGLSPEEEAYNLRDDAKRLTEALADVESAERIRTEQRNESDAECVRLTEALAEAERHVFSLDCAHRAVEARVRDLEAENERLRYERDSAWDAKEEAQNELRIQGGEADNAVVAAESRLAAATALLSKRPPNRHDGEAWSVWDTKVWTFLANQPAAPRFEASKLSLEPIGFADLQHTDGPCRNCDEGGDPGFCPRQPAAPTRTEAETWSLQSKLTAKPFVPPLTRQDTLREWELERAERAVLDDLASVPEDTLRWMITNGPITVSNVAVSELARRGLR